MGTAIVAPKQYLDDDGNPIAAPKSSKVSSVKYLKAQALAMKPILPPKGYILIHPTASVSANTPSFLDTLESTVRNGPIGRSLQSAMPKVANALGLSPTESESERQRTAGQSDEVVNFRPLAENATGTGLQAAANAMAPVSPTIASGLNVASHLVRKDTTQEKPLTQRFATGLADLPSALTTPANAAILAGTEGLGFFGDAAPIASRLLSAGFGLQMLKGLYDQSPEFRDDLKRHDYGAAAEKAGKMVGTAAMAVMAGKHALTSHPFTPVTEPVSRERTNVLHRNTAGEVRQAPGQAPSVWLSPDAMGILMKQMYPEESHVITNGFSIPRRVIESHANDPQFAHSEIKDLLTKAHENAGESGAAFAVKRDSIQQNVNVMREELNHTWQRSLAANGDFENHLKPGVFSDLRRDIPQGMYDHLAEKGYDEHDSPQMVSEAAAKFMAGNHDKFGTSAEDASKFLDKYFTDVVAQHGQQALDSLKHVKGVAKLAKEKVYAEHSDGTAGPDGGLGDGRADRGNLQSVAGGGQGRTSETIQGTQSSVQGQEGGVNDDQLGTTGGRGIPSVEGGGQGGLATTSETVENSGQTTVDASAEGVVGSNAVLPGSSVPAAVPGGAAIHNGPQDVTNAASPVPSEIIPRPDQGNNREALNDFMTRVGTRLAREQYGQEILDNMEEKDESPAAISKQFWEHTYFDMPAEAQTVMQRQLKALTGMQPGDTLAVGRNGEIIPAKDWADIADGLVGDKVEHLEGGERGYVAMMRDAIDRFGKKPSAGELPAGQDALFNREKEKPVWYLKSERLIADKMRGPQPAEDVHKMLLSGGVKPEEMQWTGLDDFLKSKGKDKVTSEEIKQHLAENNIQVKEVTKGQGSLQVKPSEEYPGEFDVVDNTGRVRFSALTKDEAEEYREREDEDDTKYGSYVLPGGESYREMLLTMPPTPRTIEHWRINRPDGHAESVYDNEGAARKEAERLGEGYTVERRPDVKMEGGFKSSHWDEPNILAHVRFNERSNLTYGPEDIKRIEAKIQQYMPNYGPASWGSGATEGAMRKGLITPEEAAQYSHAKGWNNDTKATQRRLLHVEEVQSDWHQNGRDVGYEGDYKPLTELPQGYSVKSEKMDNGDEMFWVSDPEGKRITARSYNKQGSINEALNALNDKERGTTASPVPDAPFKKTWHEMALRRILKHAVDNNFDGISWTPGEDQAERYSLSHQVDKIAVPMVKADGSRSVRIDPIGGGHDSFKMMVSPDGTVDGSYNASQFTGKKLDDVIGKEMAKKVMEAKEPVDFSGEGLKVGGSGMTGFYDKIVPDYLNKFGKRFGAKVGTTEIPFGGGGAETGKSAILEAMAKGKHGKTVQYLPITPEMRKSVAEEGVPLFNREHPYEAKDDDVPIATGYRSIADTGSLGMVDLVPNDYALISTMTAGGEHSNARNLSHSGAIDLGTKLLATANNLPEGAERNRVYLIATHIFTAARDNGVAGVPIFKIDPNRTPAEQRELEMHEAVVHGGQRAVEGNGNVLELFPKSVTDQIAKNTLARKAWKSLQDHGYPSINKPLMAAETEAWGLSGKLNRIGALTSDEVDELMWEHLQAQTAHHGDKLNTVDPTGKKYVQALREAGERHERERANKVFYGSERSGLGEGSGQEKEVPSPSGTPEGGGTEGNQEDSGAGSEGVGDEGEGESDSESLEDRNLSAEQDYPTDLDVNTNTEGDAGDNKPEQVAGSTGTSPTTIQVQGGTVIHSAPQQERPDAKEKTSVPHQTTRTVSVPLETAIPDAPVVTTRILPLAQIKAMAAQRNPQYQSRSVRDLMREAKERFTNSIVP